MAISCEFHVGESSCAYAKKQGNFYVVLYHKYCYWPHFSNLKGKWHHFVTNWRMVVSIGADIPLHRAVEEGARELALYANICQRNG